MKPGFTLIELVVGLFLSSLIGVALYNTFFVTNRVVKVADTFITTDFRAALIQNQLQKDFDGIFIPDQSDLTQTATSKQPAGKEQAGKEQKEKVEKEQQQQPPKPIEKIFYTINAPQDFLQVMTFVTNNPIKKYEKATNVVPKSRIVRVVYRLIPQEDDPQMFSLMRQESSELDFKAYEIKASKPIRAYEVATGIKSIRCEFKYPVKKEEPKEQVGPVKKAEEKPKPEYKTVKIWDVESKKEEQPEQPKIPEFITVTIEFWDEQKREEKFVFEYYLQTFNAQTAPKKTKQPERPAQPKKPEDDKTKNIAIQPIK